MGYGNPSQSVVPQLAGDASLADGTVIKVVVTYPYGGQNITLPFTGGEGMIGFTGAAVLAAGLAFIVRKRK
jgi:LPXTG-motif cell wall-anchored protein